MSLLSLKITAAILTILISIATGLLPIRSKASTKGEVFFLMGEAFASGVFLGAALLHMLPDAQLFFRHSGFNQDFPIANFVCILGFLLILLIEKVSYGQLQTTDKVTRNMTASLLVIVLSVHSIIAGAALGIESSYNNALIILIAILAHKGSASFALGVQVNKTEFTLSKKRMIIIVFSLMTTIGIIFGTSISHFFQLKKGELVEALFTAFAAGTFLYIGTLHAMTYIFKQNVIRRVSAFVVMLVGIAMMAILAFWV